MEFYSQSLDSDEAVELSITENGEEICARDFPYLEEENQLTVLEAKTVYILLPKNIPVSRATRLQWLLDHLNNIITVPAVQKWNNVTNEMEVLSAVPREQTLTKCNRFQITCRTEVQFLAHSYRFVYCLDMSPSQATVDIQKGEILLDEILNCFKTSVEGLTKQFIIPGGAVVFSPNIFLTVMVNTPFFMSPAQQVLVKGVQLNSSNLQDVITFVQNQFNLIEGKIADVAAVAHDQIEVQRVENEGIIGGLFNLHEKEQIGAKIPMVSPDANFVNMLRYSMLAVSLLPEYSLSHILVITDGVVAMPDSNIMESLLFQLHYDSIAVSFLKVGSPFHPHSSSGYVSYMDLLYFFAHSTLGTCLEVVHNIKQQPSMSLNIYHDLFLMWSFHTLNKYIYPQAEPPKWSSQNEIFHGHKKPNLLSKRQTEEKASASILLLLYRRMREGFTVDTVSYANGRIEIKLSLQWKSFIYIYYKVASQWPVAKAHNTHFEIHIAAPYEFLHDITCPIKKENKSSYRMAIIKRFWLRISQLSLGEIGLAQQLSVFQFSPVWYNLPESIRSGIPAFIVNNAVCSDNAKQNLIPSDTTCPKFMNVWQPICLIEGNNWRKWFHMHKISLVLRHDQQLPKHLHLANSSHRYQVVHCRQAATALYGMLTEWATFVLIDNNTYLKLLNKEPDKPPTWFCVVRISSKLPCVVLNIAFLTTTPGSVRQNIVEQMKSELLSLTYLSSRMRSKEFICCTLLEKPLEKMLIRYERMPSDFTTVIFPDGTQPPHTTLTLPSPLTGSLFTTLSRYLYHKRWIWNANDSISPRLTDNALSRILSTLTKMRIEEGFNFAYSSAGIITMVLELWMESNLSCVVQYVLFPPNYGEGNSVNDDSNSYSDDDIDRDCESEMELQLITEVWIEPQYGKVQTTNPRINYLNNKQYFEIADVISKIDLQCINSLLTMEHLSLMCQEKNRSFSLNSTNLITKDSTNQGTTNRKYSKSYFLDSPSADVGSQWYPIIAPRIENIPFNFDPISILPLCQQTELLFSMFIQASDKCKFIQKTDFDKSNKLLLDNIHDHFGSLHDYELDLTKEDSDRFTKQILLRHRNKHPHYCPINDYIEMGPIDLNEDELPVSQWRCLLKGISVTHVILTFMPASLEDLKFLIALENINIPSNNDLTEGLERCSSRGSNFSDVPYNVGSSLTLPIYIYDCPLGILVNAYIHNTNETYAVSNDIYEDHRFTFSDYIQEDCVRLKEDFSQISPEPRSASDESESSEPKSNVKLHCRALVLAHSKSFVLSLFIALHCGTYVHSSDVQSAMDQCEENITEIDITNYILTVCGHVKHSMEEKINIKHLHQATPCSELKSLHNLIKEKFFKVVNVSFNPIPTNSEFYFFRTSSNHKKDSKQNDSDDEMSNPSEIAEFKSERDLSIYSEGPHLLQRMESAFSGVSDILLSDFFPLFLHLICTIRYNNGGVSNTSVRVLPTCLGELIQTIESSTENFDRTKLHVTLDILCLTLPNKVQNVITEYSSQGLRSTSFSSDGFQPSLGSPVSETSFIDETHVLEPLLNLPELQRKSLIVLHEEIEWLLRDEITTALLDINPVTLNTLHFVVNHVSSNSNRSSCDFDKINLNFVYGASQSQEKFIEVFSKIAVPYYKLCKEEDFYYLTKKENVEQKTIRNITNNNSGENKFDYGPSSSLQENLLFNHLFKTLEDFKDDIASQQSDISSVNDSVVGTDGGYDEDVSDDYEDYEWLQQLDNKRPHLPNFWLILKIEQDVSIYFHCRFLELPTSQVGIYLQIQRSVKDAIKDLCKNVNQSLLLQSLYETKICNALLEVEDNFKDWRADNFSPSPRNASYSRLKSMEETNDEMEFTSGSSADMAAPFKMGEFSCPVVWETYFNLHPRLKTGPGKSIISRGILALKNILDKFSVSNRNNMFVYRDNKNNVFYLRLQETMQNSFSKFSPKASEYESAMVSRSPSIASLPLGQNKSTLVQSDSVSSITSSEIRPRVRSFGEKESKDTPNEDTLILKVHGITEAGEDVQCDLVQVLQNRLDDAVLEFLSIMLARNSMCPLTPEDVHFIQKPFRPPEIIIRLSVEDFALNWLDSFIHYLKQNLLQFLNVPKYTDLRSHYHFKDYSDNEQTNNTATEDNIFVYNQSQNPSSGNRGIACIALNLVNHSEVHTYVELDKFKSAFETRFYDNIITAQILDENDNLPSVYLEFKLWKQGRVNIDNLSKKLKSAVCQATWDIIMEYFLLKEPLCQLEEPIVNIRLRPTPIEELDIDFTKEIEFNIVIGSNKKRNMNKRTYCMSKRKNETNRRLKTIIPPKRKTSRSITFDSSDKNFTNPKTSNANTQIKLNSFEIGDEGILCDTYSKFLPDWFEYGASLSVPAVKKHRVVLSNRHLPCITIKELLNIIQDNPKAFHAIPLNPLKTYDEYKYTVYNAHSNSVQKCVIISRNFEHWKAATSYNVGFEVSEIVNGHTLKHVQKFLPSLSSNVFVPRQKILWILVESDNIIIYTYNWTKEKIDKLITNCTNLGQWLSVRSCFLNSITSQKLGLFHNQSIARKNFLNSNNPYAFCIGSVESMRELPSKRTMSSMTLAKTLEAFRDTFKQSLLTSHDIVVVFTTEMQEIKSLEETSKEEMKQLHSMYQSRTSSTAIPQIFLLMQNSRIIHYCHTPLLFLPRWRFKSAATRDHSLFPSQAIRIVDKIVPSEKESWHSELCYGFFSEYRRYLQTLGFMPLQFDNNQNHGLWSKDNSSYDSVFYIQKTILGGILLFTVEFVEPFFITKLHAIECNRLQNVSSRASINRFTLSFLDECDRVKIFMHLHSFTYDYHLRCIYNYISNNQGVNKVCDRYNVNHFLDDFMKYYNKAPNFARNLVHADTLTIKDLVTEGKQLYDYLLTNVEQYNFKALEMDRGDNETEHILVQVTSTPQVSYKDSHDRQHTDDFEITLVVHNMCIPYNPTDNILHLKYYLILTSKQEIYPKSEVEQKLGKFRTVSSTCRSLSAMEREAFDSEASRNILTSDTECEITSSEDQNMSSSENEDTVVSGISSSPQSNPKHVEICSESVNYLGYYSSHEQLMQQLILDKANTTQKHIKDMVAKGMVDCRTNLLWNKLVSLQDAASLTYDEFMELKGLANLEHLCNVHPNLGPLLNQSLPWYEGLSRLLLVKYNDHKRVYISGDGNTQHYVILHPIYFGAFMLLSLDFHTFRGDLYAVYREPNKLEDANLCSAYRKELIDGFVNCISFYLWSGMI